MTDEKVELSEPFIKVQTSPCLVCHQTTLVELTRTEFKALAEMQVSVQEALPDRDAGFRELFITGTHAECWDTATKGGDSNEASS
jgi:hypothetical protein